jgi:hypothetical protein
MSILGESLAHTDPSDPERPRLFGSYIIELSKKSIAIAPANPSGINAREEAE